MNYLVRLKLADHPANQKVGSSSLSRESCQRWSSAKGLRVTRRSLLSGR